MGNQHSHGKFLHIAIAATLFLSSLMGRGAGVVNSATEAALNTALTGGGTVTFGFDGTITVTSPKTISTNTVIDGGGHTITLSGGGSSQLFLVSTGATLTLANLTIANGRTSTNGGAIYNQGTLAAFSCAFTNNFAIGTNGPDGATGGGGGLYGTDGKPGGAGGSVAAC